MLKKYKQTKTKYVAEPGGSVTEIVEANVSARWNVVPVEMVAKVRKSDRILQRSKSHSWLKQVFPKETLMKTVWFSEPVMRGLSLPSTKRSSSTGHLSFHRQLLPKYILPFEQMYFSL